MKNNQIDFLAPIIPGKSAGGFELGMKKDEINNKVIESFAREVIKNKYVPDISLTRFSSKDLILFFTNGILDQIGVVGNYKGKLESGLGLGNYVHEFEKIYGQITEGTEDELIFSNLEG